MTIPPSLSGHIRIVSCTDLPFGEIGEELMALDAKNGEVLGLDKVGTRIWHFAEQPISIDDMVGRLGEEYDADEATIRKDIAPFIDDLVASGLLRIAT